MKYLTLIPLVVSMATAHAVELFNTNQFSSGAQAPLSIKSGALVTNTSLTTPVWKAADGTTLIDSVGGNLKLRQSSGEPVLDANNSSLLDIDTGSESVQWSNRDLVGTNGNSTANWETPALKVDTLKGKSAAPTVVHGAGAATNGSVTITGTALAGKITVVTGSLPMTNSVIATVTFPSALEDEPFVVLWPANSQAGNLWFMPWVGATSTAFTINSTDPLAGATTYKWNYIVIQ